MVMPCSCSHRATPPSFQESTYACACNIAFTEAQSFACAGTSRLITAEGSARAAVAEGPRVERRGGAPSFMRFWPTAAAALAATGGMLLASMFSSMSIASPSSSDPSGCLPAWCCARERVVAAPRLHVMIDCGSGFSIYYYNVYCSLMLCCDCDCTVNMYS
jgi:hypothetical protein